MMKTSFAAPVFAAVMLMAAVPGYCGGAVGQDPHRGTIATKAAPGGRIDTVNLAAASLMRHVVEAAPRGNQVAR
jgi:hypothetical protein